MKKSMIVGLGAIAFQPVDIFEKKSAPDDCLTQTGHQAPRVEGYEGGVFLFCQAPMGGACN